MDYQIITNNPKIKSKYPNVIYVDGSYEDVLIRTRELVHSGYELINHPLGASIRMLFSPYRSIIIGNKQQNINSMHVEVIENSIVNYRKHMEVRKPDIENSEDYSIVDSELLQSSLEEYKRIYN